jgi:hypothetical protein
MDEMLRKAICDYFEAGDFAEYIGISVDDLITAFPDEVDDALEEIKELIEWEDVEDDDD